MTTYTQPKPVGTPTWVDLSSPDPAASRDFYHAVFGWEYDIGGPEFGGYATARVGPLPTAGIGGQFRAPRLRPHRGACPSPRMTWMPTSPAPRRSARRCSSRP